MAEQRDQEPQEVAQEREYGFGRSRPLTAKEQHRLAQQQGELIASGRARKGQIVLNTPLRRAIFIGGLAGIVLLVLIVGVAA